MQCHTGLFKPASTCTGAGFDWVPYAHFPETGSIAEREQGFSLQGRQDKTLPPQP